MRNLLWALLIMVVRAGLAYGAGAAWVVTTDYSGFGRVRAFDQVQPWSVSGDLATIPGDAVARYHAGLVYVVGRGGANLLQVYDPAAGFALVREFSLGSGLNPQDIAFDRSGEAYISCYDQAVLLRVDVTAETILGTYSTAAYADADGIPETSWCVAQGDKLYLTCQKLDRNNWYAPTGPGQLLVFDMADETFLAPIDLVGADPYTQIEVQADGLLRVGCAGFFGVADGGIEEIDPAAGSSLGYIVTEAALGGDVTAFVTTGTGVIHVLISDPAFVTSLRRYDQATDRLTVLATGGGYVHADVAFDGGFQLYVADRTPAASGLRVYDISSGTELTGSVLATGLPPFMIVLPGAPDLSPVPPVAGLGELTLAPPFPNPCNPRAEVVLSGRPGAAVRVSIFDLAGRRLLVEATILAADGTANWLFTGLDSRGRSLPAGVYRVVAQSGTGFAARSITLVK